MGRRFAVATFAVVLCFGGFAVSPTSAACTYLEYTSEMCRSAGGIWFDYPASKWVPKGTSAQINLQTFAHQIYWYCGSSRERTAWGTMANRLNVDFQNDGRIDFRVYKCIHCTFVDRTYDKCSGSNYIEVRGQRINKGSYNGEVNLPGMQRQVFWYCGNSRERTAWGEDANQLRINYFSSDGRIEWKIYKCT